MVTNTNRPMARRLSLGLLALAVIAPALWGSPYDRLARDSVAERDAVVLADTLLPELVVRAEWMRQRDGDVVVSVPNLPSAQRLRADQLLSQLPGVVSSKGAYTLNGKPAVIYINGIKQVISAESMSAFLSSLPASALSSVELVGVNTGKYSASTEAVIHIHTHPNVPLGYSFQPYVYTMFLPNGVRSLGGNLFYMTKVNRILTHHTLSYSRDQSRSTLSDSLLLSGVPVIHNDRDSRGYSHVLTYQGSLSYELERGRRLHFNAFVYNDFDDPQVEWVSTRARGTEDARGRSDLYNLSAAYQIPSTQTALYGTISYALSYGGRHSRVDYLTDARDLYNRGDLDLEGWMHTLSADFSSHIGDRWLLTYGAQVDRNSVWDRVHYYKPGASTPGGASYFEGAELLPAAYAQVRYKLSEELSLRAGARVEHTSYHYRLEDLSPTRRYTNVFPSLLVYYNRPNYALTAGLTSSVSRPRYEWLIPGERRRNDYLSFVGNPDVRPTRTYALVVRNTLMRYAQLNLTYAWVQDYAGSIYTSRGERLTESVDNIADRRLFRINAVVPFALLSRKLTGQLQATLGHNRFVHFSPGYTPPESRQTQYWTQTYAGSVQYEPSDRLTLSVQGQFTPRLTSLFVDTNRQLLVDLELYYALLRERNLILSLSLGNLFAHDTTRSAYFLDHRLWQRSDDYQPYVQVSLKLRLGKGQKVVDEYRSYTPGVSRMR